MPSFTAAIFSFAALASLAHAISITSPGTNAVWDLSQSQTITWTSVNTDPDNVDIYLAHMASNPPLNDLLSSNVAVSDGTFTVTGLQLPDGADYQINFVKVGSPDQIYAQSQQFTIDGVASQASSTLAGFTGATTTSTPEPTSTSTSISTSTVSKKDASTTLTSSITSGSATTLSSSTGSAAASTSSTGTATTTSSSSTGTSSASGAASSSGASSSATPSATAKSGASAMAAPASFAALVMGVFAALL